MIDQAIYQDEVLRVGLPLSGADQLAIDRIGPTIIISTPSAEKRYLLKMLTGEEIWSRVIPSRARAQTSRACRRARCSTANLRNQRAESVDQFGASRGLAGAAGAHRCRGAKA